MRKKVGLRFMVLWVVGLSVMLGMVKGADGDLPKVLIIGDSISLGYTNDVANLLEGKVEVVRPKNEKGGRVNCGPTERGLEYIDQWLGDTKWDVIHFNWGLHDLCYRNPNSKTQGGRDKINGVVSATVEQYQANLAKLVLRMKKTGAKLIWGATTPVPEGEAGRIAGDALKYNAAALKVMQENNIAINDLHSYIFPELAKYQRPDGNVHFLPEGSQYLAERVAAFIEAAIGPVNVELWPDGVPGSKGDEPKDHPSMQVYLPMQGNATGAAVLICPGGGYGHLAMDHEGKQIAEWLNSFGVAGVVLDYRHRGNGYGYPAPLDDAQRAMRLIRSNSKLWAIDPGKIGVLGFSAGGHLASTVTTLFDTDYGKAGEETDALSSRPDFSVLCYPVISMTQPFMHIGSRNNLLGKEDAPELEKLMSTELQVTDKTPPVFLLHAGDDRGVPVENSLAFYKAMLKAKVPGQVHIYDKGGHGFGLGKGKGTTEGWPNVCRDWILSVIGD